MGTASRVLEVLTPFDIKQEARGRYRLNSPLRPGSNSHGFVLTIHDEEFGTFYDHAHEEDQGSLFTLAERLGVTTASRIPVQSTKRVYQDIQDYAEAHGIDVRTLADAGWKSVTHEGRPALSFPTKNGMRYRFLDGETPAYKHASGYKKCWYGLQRAIDLANKYNQPLVLCNGEISTVVAQFYEIAACAVTSGEGSIPEPLLQELKTLWTDDVLIGMDHDAKGQLSNQKILAQIPGAKILDYQLGEGGDLADFCRLYGEEARERLLACVLQVKSPPTSIESLAKAVSELAKLRKQDADRGTIESVIERLKQELAHFERQNTRIEMISFADLVADNTRGVLEAAKTKLEVRGLRSPFIQFDKQVGGFVGGRLHILYGATGMGKTTCVAAITAKFIEQQQGLIIPTEVPPLAWLNKLAGAMVKISADDIEAGRLTPVQLDEVLDAYEKIASSSGQFMKSGSPTIPMIREAVLQAKAQRDIQFLIVDSLTKIAVPGVTNIYDITRYAADGLQDIAYDTGIMILATCQTGRNAKNRKNKIPRIEDALGAGTVEQNADVIIGLYRHQYYVERGVAKPDPQFSPNTTLSIILKHRWKTSAVGKITLFQCVNGAAYFEEAQEHEPLGF